MKNLATIFLESIGAPRSRSNCHLVGLVSLATLALGATDSGDALPALGKLKPSHELLIHSGETLAFMGDSITQLGSRMPGGYCRLVIRTLRDYGVDVKPIYAGHGGDQSADMLKRLDREVLAYKPNWMTLSCGVNDCWVSIRHDKVIPVEQYSKNVTDMVDKCEKSGTKVIILTPTMINMTNTDENNADNQYLKPHVEWLLKFAKERNLPCVDLNGIMRGLVKAEPIAGKKIVYTFDYGTHMNPRGFRMMARGVLGVMGLTKPEIDARRDEWLDIPGGWAVDGISVSTSEKLPDGKTVSYEIGAVMALTPREYTYFECTPSKEGIVQFWTIPKGKVIPALFKDHGGPYQSLSELAQSPAFPSVKKQVQADCDRLLANEVAKGKEVFDRYMSGLSDEQRRMRIEAEQ